MSVKGGIPLASISTDCSRILLAFCSSNNHIKEATPMNTKTKTLVPLLLIVLMLTQSSAQFKDAGLGGGIGFGGTFGQTELRDRQGSFLARAFLRYGLINHLSGEFGAGLGRVSGSEFRTQIIPIDYRFVISPFSFENWNPYLYAGAGALHFKQELAPPNPTPGAKVDGWTGYIPAGIGMQFKLDDQVVFEMSGGYNHTFSDDLNAVQVGEKDAYFNFLLGLTVTGESGNADPDGDGLTNREEKELKTNPKVADTDGDGLSDGAEVREYNTHPLKADTDGDGLSDGDEVLKYKTDPLKTDTDGDGLSDGDEVMKYRTDPLKADTDGDGLSDGDEVMKYKTDPLKADTDGDGLNDGDEVLRYKTDPLKADTDGGSVNDGKEIARGTNPLDPADDVPRKEELKVEAGRAIVLEGIVFATGKSDITPESETTLEKAYNTMAQNEGMVVEIQGHTDNTGSQATNMKLSQARAEAVKAWLVKKGIASDRITAKGFGPDKPVADNKTKEGRQKNRRIEFFRVK
jgi:outer membrane protein OmpA-like peptidoglycan-associated protein